MYVSATKARKPRSPRPPKKCHHGIQKASMAFIEICHHGFRCPPGLLHRLKLRSSTVPRFPPYGHLCFLPPPHLSHRLGGKPKFSALSLRITRCHTGSATWAQKMPHHHTYHHSKCVQAHTYHHSKSLKCAMFSHLGSKGATHTQPPRLRVSSVCTYPMSLELSCLGSESPWHVPTHKAFILAKPFALSSDLGPQHHSSS